MMVLDDNTRDTGCGLKALRRDVFLALPYFDGCTASFRHWFSATVTTLCTSMLLIAAPARRPTTECGTASKPACLRSPAAYGETTNRRKHIPAVSEVKRDA